MVAPNYPDRTRRFELDTKPHAGALSQRLRQYFDEHPQLSREDFWFGAREHEVDRQSLIQDMAIHAWLVERQAIVDRHRNGWRAKARRLFQW